MELPVGTLQQLEAATEIVCNQTWAEVRPVPHILHGWAGGWAIHLFALHIERPSHFRLLAVIGRLKKCPEGDLGTG